MSWQKSQSVLRMEARVAADPHDTDAWSALLAEAVSHQPDDFRSLFDACLTAVPMLATAWRQWIFAEMHAGQPAAVEGIFERCLLKCPQLELWTLYMQYMRQEKLAARTEVLQAFEVLLEAVGTDPASGPLWLEYVQLTRDGTEASASLSNAQINDIRRAYQGALLAPVIGLEGVAREYEEWEARLHTPPPPPPLP